MQELSEYGKQKQQEIDLTKPEIWKPIYEEIKKIQRGESSGIKLITQEEEKDLRAEIKKLKERVEALEKRKISKLFLD